MRVVSFRVGDKTSWGVTTDGEGIVDLGAREGGSVLERLTSGKAIASLADLADLHSPDVAVGDVILLPPVVCGPKIICIGVNYANRNAEYKDQTPDPEWPSLFMRGQESFTGSGQSLWRPPESPQLDYEGEIVMVIGKAGHRIPQDKAMEHVAGYTLMNEGTIRDWVRHAKFNVTQGKNFPCSGAIGPWLVDAAEVGNHAELALETRVNGELRQQDTTANLMFPFDYLVSYLSIFYTLQPGDMISTGTPNGAGARFDPPRYLAPGDVVEVTCPSIGTLRNTVADDPTAEKDMTLQLRSNRQV
ncbi:MAG: fumarylacetoacetate hydrolase family protein [Halieaceae bacterium]|nr:fumarylacetoacetate hydrolase family protein [Halieaceae bacterium]MBT6333536.1 fumarylacetoacetate hydrolase family protein [Halieaceae bacterium]